MNQARLFTRSGGYVATVHSIPPFHTPAEAIMWGSRFFVRANDTDYVEALVWAAADIQFEHGTITRTAGA